MTVRSTIDAISRIAATKDPSTASNAKICSRNKDVIGRVHHDSLILLDLEPVKANTQSLDPLQQLFGRQGPVRLLCVDPDWLVRRRSVGWKDVGEDVSQGDVNLEG